AGWIPGPFARAAHVSLALSRRGTRSHLGHARERARDARAPSKPHRAHRFRPPAPGRDARLAARPRGELDDRPVGWTRAARPAPHTSLYPKRRPASGRPAYDIRGGG